jgi:hypothetical protein
MISSITCSDISKIQLYENIDIFEQAIDFTCRWMRSKMMKALLLENMRSPTTREMKEK